MKKKKKKKKKVKWSGASEVSKRQKVVLWYVHENLPYLYSGLSKEWPPLFILSCELLMHAQTKD